MDYQVYWITATGIDREWIHAEISLRPEVEGILEEKGAMGFYVAQRHIPTFAPFLEQLNQQLAFSCSKETIADQNWNAVWESQFEPVNIDDWVYIRADFHAAAPPHFAHELVINPANAFGTGHHETTRLIMRWMRHAPLDGCTVLDFGAGTGILGILAMRLGAQQVLGIDIRPEAVESMTANAALNQVEILACLGSAGEIDHRQFDLVVANVNLDVLQVHAGTLSQSVKHGGHLVVSGILSGDDRAIRMAYPDIVWDWMDQEDEWIALAGFKK
ncbi:MAG: 50S ribosomal protein L11 methyltransferase [Saprospiraceae bacterium]